MNKETRDFFGCEVFFDEKKLRKVLASQLDNHGYRQGKKTLVEIVFNRHLDYVFRKNALELIFKHMNSQGVVVYGNSGISTSEMLTILKEVL